MRPSIRPKILFLTRSLDFGGAQRQLVELATGLHDLQWDVKVATFYAGGALAQPLRDRGITTISLEKAGRWDVFGFALRLIRLLRRERPHIAHGYLDLSNILLTLLSWCTPATRVVWGVRASNMDIGNYGALFRLECRLSVLLSRFADLIICNSHAGHAHHAKSGFADARMLVIANGVDVTRFRPDAQARAEVRGEWGIAPTAPLVGLVGRLDPMKDQAGFLRAAALVAASHPEVRFVCVGDGPLHYRQGLVELSRRLGIAERVLWSNARSDVWRVHNALDVAVSASSFGEGFSNTIAEAMAAGVACVVTDVGDSAALVGNVGWVCPPDDSAALAKGMVQAIHALPVDGAAVRQRILENFSASHLIDRTASHLGGIISDLCVCPGPEAPESRHP